MATRQTPLRDEGLGEGGRGLLAGAEVGAFGILVLAPGGQRGASMVQGREQRLVQQFIPQAAVEAFDKGILGRLSWCGVMPVNRRFPAEFDRDTYKWRHLIENSSES